MYQKADGHIDIYNKIDNKIDMSRFIGSYYDRCLVWFRKDAMSGASMKDWSFNREDSPITGGVWTTTGKFKTHCLYFDGIDDKIDLSTANFIPTNMTVELWGKTSSAARQFYVSKGKANAYCWGMEINAGFVRWTIWTCAGLGYLIAWSPTGVWNDGSWHHIVGMLDNGVIARLYIDGNLITTDNTPSGTRCILETAKTLVGSREDCCPFDGYIDETRIYNRVLEADEIKKRWEIGRQPPL